MIKIRLSSFEKTNKDSEINIVEGENLLQAVTRAIEVLKVKEDPKKTFKAVVNGTIIKSEMWEVTHLKSSDRVLVAPSLQSGDGTIGSLLVLAALIAVAPYTGPLIAAGGLSAVGGGLVNAGVAFLASYVASQLIPPPVTGSGLVGNGNLQESQMYSITSQANAVNKFGRVPKVYGEHRMFPFVAANPYTELEVDPATGKLAQYLYGIYDFGLGTNIVTDIKIGTTDIEEFNEVTTRIVDINKPVVSEGSWDDLIYPSFTLYKGDVFSEQIGTTLNGDQAKGDPQSEYQIIRNAATNVANKKQEITLNFVNPNGLTAFNSGGTRVDRTIDLEIMFSKVGEDNWRPFNDPTWVEMSRTIGGDAETSDKTFTTGEFNPLSFDPNSVPTYLTILSSEQPKTRTMRYGRTVQTTRRYTLGISRYHPIVVAVGHGFTIGDRIKYRGQVIGTVSAIDGWTFGYNRITLANRVPIDIVLTEFVEILDVMTIDEFVYGNLTRVPTNANCRTNVLTKAGDILGQLRITAATQEQYYSTVKFSPKEIASYKMRITRLDSRSNATTQIIDDLALININTRTDTAPIVTNKRHTFMEVRIKASGQLNGSIQNLSAKCTSVLPMWNGSAWVKGPTNNPAWVFADLMTGEVNKRPISFSRLDTTTLREWADHCDAIPNSSAAYTYYEKRFTCNFVLDFETTLQQLLNQVAGAAQASLNIVDGKYGVLLDVQRSVPVQIFTSRNSTAFSSNRGYTKRPHAVKVSYVDPNSEWQPNEIVVYDDTYSEANATEFDELQTFACTQVEQAFRFGRYFIAQNKLRQENISIKVDFEHLVCTRGDYVQLVRDTMKVGGSAARVKSIVGDIVTIDDGIVTDPLLNYSFVFRGSDGQIRQNSLTVLSSTTFQLDGGDYPQEDDLIVIGESGQVVFDCLVKSITPSDDLSAILNLVEKADPIYSIEKVDAIPGYSPKISGTVDSNTTAPLEVTNLAVLANSYDVKNAGYEYYVKLDWDSPAGSAYELFEVYVDWGAGYELAGSTKLSEFRYIVDQSHLGTAHLFKVLAVSATGSKLGLGQVGYVTATPIKKVTPPSDVARFNSDITGETIQLFWDLVPDPDIKEYVIRYVPVLNGAWYESTTVLRVSASTSLAATQARTGTYLIKAVDLNGNESNLATAIPTTIPSLNGLNVVEAINDFPTLTGQKDRVDIFSDSLILRQEVSGPLGTEQYYSEGYYYFQDLLDLGEIYQVRLQGQIKAQGYVATDIMSNWASLADIDLLYSPTSADWDVELQYRSTNSLNVMGDWPSLSSVALLSGGSEEIWTDWRKFIIGDATGRIFQFRIKLISKKANVSPRVLDATVLADMPDRVESYNNLSATTSGLVVTYTPAFKASPNVQISLENGQTGDYWEYVSKTAEGFEIVFKNNLGNPVARQFDAQIKGYGRKAVTVI